VVFTDHKPLVGALHHPTDPRSDRQRRQLSFITEFTADIVHIAGPTNIVADTLSRPTTAESGKPSYAAVVAGTSSSGPQASRPMVAAAAGLQHPSSPSLGCSSPSMASSPSLSCSSPSMASSSSAGVCNASVAAAPPLQEAQRPPVDLAALAVAQSNCPDCKRGVSSASLRVVSVQLESSHILVDVSSGVMRPLVPAAFRRQIFNAVHSLAHPGIRASRRMISSRYVWPNLASDVPAWCKDCTECQRAKVTKQPAAAVQPIPVPAVRFSHVHVDIVGPLPVSKEGFPFLLILFIYIF
jgi:Integrase zinc binding domain